MAARAAHEPLLAARGRLILVEALRRSGRRATPGRTSDWKKAVVTLAEGQKLEGLYGNV